MRARVRVGALLAIACVGYIAAMAPAAVAGTGFGDRALREGTEGADVEALQRKLTRLGFETEASGYFGVDTKRSMRRWEREGGRKVNATCSRVDARRIKRQVKRRREAEPQPGVVDDTPIDPESPTDSDGGEDYGPERAYGSRRLEEGDRGSDVARLQRLLTDQGLPTDENGTFDASTKTSVEKWEAWQYRRADGAVTRGQAMTTRDLAEDGARYEARNHVFPVRGPHSYGGAGSRFGAPRSGHTHKGQDVAAAEGTPLVAVHDGTVHARQYQAGGAGHYVVIHGDDGSDSVYMHMPRRAIVAPGEQVMAGERIGRVGSTGASTGPHLHFELWTPHWFDGGSAYDPLRKLQRWDRQTP
jgi:murein DD-endopeptidase MepM/ murein hydrolase activator NlpD